MFINNTSDTTIAVSNDIQKSVSTSTGNTKSVVKSSTNNTTVNNVSENPQLELLNFRCYEEYDYFQIVGQVKNITDQSLKNVEVVGTVYTKTGEYVNSEDSLIDYNPILPGQTSSFKVMMTNNPEMSKCNVDFKYFWGTSIKVQNDTIK